MIAVFGFLNEELKLAKALVMNLCAGLASALPKVNRDSAAQLGFLPDRQINHYR